MMTHMATNFLSRALISHFLCSLGAILLSALIAQPLASAQTPQLTVASASTLPNTEVDVPITFTAGGPSSAISANQWDLIFPSTLSVVSVTDGPATTAAGKAAAYTGLTYSDTSIRGERILIFGFNTNLLGSGVLATVRFRVPVGTAPGAIPITISGIVSASPDGQGVPTSGASGSISVPDQTAPTISITSPIQGAVVSGTIPVTANATDDAGVVGVQFKLDGNNLGSEDLSAPFSVNWNTATASNGTHTLTALARDATGNTTTSSAITVTVSSTNVDNTPPTVTITAPSNGTAVSGTISVSANASDNVGVAGVQFRVDGVNLGAEDTSAPFSVQWNTTLSLNGSHSLVAVARDAAGNTTTSSAVTVTVTGGGADTTAPNVTITSPSNGATVSGLVTVSADATDNLGVVGVQFKVDNFNLGVEDTSAPYTVSWDTSLTTNSAHQITAVARDAAGNTRTAPVVSVNVSNFGGGSDIIPPVRSLGTPTGELPAETGGATVTLLTNETSTCRFSNSPDVPFASMTNVFLSADGVTHSTAVSQLENGQSYNFYVRCQDTTGNANTEDFAIQFKVGTLPISVFRDFNKDGLSDIVLYTPKGFRVFSGGGELPGLGTVFTGKLASGTLTGSTLGSGNPAGKTLSSLIVVKNQSNVLKWEQLSPVTNRSTKFKSFGSQSDIPLFECYSKKKLIPAVISKSGNTRTLKFYPTGSKKLKAISFTETLDFARCLNELNGNSTFLLISKNKTSRSLIGYTYAGKRAFKTVRLSQALRKAKFGILPPFAGSGGKLFYMLTRSGVSELGIFDTIRRRWDVTRLSQNLGSIRGVTAGNHGGLFRWVGALSSDGKFSSVRLRKDFSFVKVDSISTIIAKKSEKLLE